MILLKSLFNIWRSKPKVFLFFFLILLITTILSLSLGVCVSTQMFLDKCNDNYTTIAVLEYMSPDYPDISVYDENMQQAFSEFDFSLMEDNENVISWNKSARALGYVEGFERRDYNRPLRNYCVLVVKDLNHHQLSKYFGEIVEPMSSDEEPNIVVYVEPTFTKKVPNFDPDGIYVIHGEFFKGWFTSVRTEPFIHYAAKAAGVNDGQNYMISDVTDEYKDGHLDKENIFNDIAKTYNVMKSSMNVFAVSDINAIYEFNQEQLFLTKGRLFTDEEYMQGSNVCIVSSLFAKMYGADIGDVITLSQVITENASYDESYWAGTGFTHSGKYEIVGISNENADCNFNIYITKSPDIDYTINQIGYTVGSAVLDNDGAAAFYNEVVQKLPDRMRLTVYDQGYSNAVRPFKDILRISKIIAAISILAATAILIFFGFVFVYRQRDVSDIMIKMGSGRFMVIRYFLYASLIISILAAICGVIISHALSGYVTDLVKNIADNYVGSDLGFSNGSLSLTNESVFNNQIQDSFLVYMGGSVVICCFISCLMFTIVTFKKKKKQKKRKVMRKTKGHTSTIRSASLKYAVLSAARGKMRTLIVPIVAISIVLLLSQLVFTSIRYQQNLYNITENALVSGHFTDIKGKAVDKVPIDAYQVKDLNNSGFVEEQNVSKSSNYFYLGKYDQNMGEFLEEPFQIPAKTSFAYQIFLNNIKRGPKLVYCTSIKSSPDFYYSASVETEYLEGYDESILAQEIEGIPCCIVSTDFLQEQNIEFGDIIRILELNMFLAKEESEMDMMVVGSYEKQGSKDNIYCQLGAYIDPDMIYNYQSEDNEPLFEYTFDSANFKLANASELNDFKTFMRDYGFSSPSGLGKYRTFIILEDMKFNNTVDMLTQQIRYINMLYPVLYALLGIISVIVSYLLVVSRRKEFAIMRGLGAMKRTTFMSFFIEQALMCLMGTLVGLGIGLFIYGTFNMLQIYLIAGFVAAYFVGCTISISIMNNKTVLSILRYED